MFSRATPFDERFQPVGVTYVDPRRLRFDPAEGLHVTTSQRVLIVGLDPEKLDMSAPGLPPGVSVEALKAGIAGVKTTFEAHGDRLDSCGLNPGGPIEQILEAQLAQGPMTAWSSEPASACRSTRFCCSSVWSTPCTGMPRTRPSPSTPAPQIRGMRRSAGVTWVEASSCWGSPVRRQSGAVAMSDDDRVDHQPSCNI